MPRANRPRRRGQESTEPPGLDRVLAGRARTESRRDGLWNVQPHPSGSALKTYACPGCGLEIGIGVAHVVTWRADGILGDADDLAGRRHWHEHCWRIRP